MIKDINKQILKLLVEHETKTNSAIKLLDLDGKSCLRINIPVLLVIQERAKLQI